MPDTSLNGWRWPTDQEKEAIQQNNHYVFSSKEDKKGINAQRHFLHDHHIIVGEKVFVEYESSLTYMTDNFKETAATNK